MGNKRRGTLPTPGKQRAGRRNPRRLPTALIIAGSDHRITLPLEYERFSIGSDGSNDLVLDDHYASALHCTLERQGTTRLIIRDRRSRNGSYVNGCRVFEAEIEIGTRILIGTTRISFVGPSSNDSCALDLILGDDTRLRAAIETAIRAARSRTPIMLLGESGTGKELFARLVHESSKRHGGPFVPVNCGAIARDLIESELFGHERGAFTGATDKRRGVFEVADGGTLFLDEIGEFPLAQQARLLRVLETHEIRPVGSEHARSVDTRVVTATHRHLVDSAEQGEFRFDLYHRLAGVEIHLPALRERPDDIPLLAEYFLQQASAEFGPRKISRDTMRALCEYTWPGNVRELRNAIHRACLLGDRDVRLCDLLPRRGPRPAVARPRKPPVGGTMHDIFLNALQIHGTYRRAARALGISKSTLHDRARRAGITWPPHLMRRERFT